MVAKWLQLSWQFHYCLKHIFQTTLKTVMFFACIKNDCGTVIYSPPLPGLIQRLMRELQVRILLEMI